MKKIKSFILGMFLIAFQTTSAAAPEESWGEFLRRQVAELVQGATPQAATPIDPQQAEEELIDAAEELIDAAREGNVAKVQQLLDAGVNVNISLCGGTALMHAAGQKHKDIVEMLLDAGADVNATNQLGATALSSAAFRRRKDIVEILLQAGANKGNVEQRARDGGHQDIADLIRYYEPLGYLTKSAGKR